MVTKEKLRRIVPYQKQINLKNNNINCYFFFLFCLSLISTQSSQAMPFDPDLSVTTHLDLDSHSIPTSGTANQTTMYTITQAGIATITNINNLTAVPALPMNGNLTDTDDSIEINSQSTGNAPNAHSGLLTDLTLTLQNTSATKTFSVNLQIQTNLSASVNGADVAADTKTTLQNNGINLIADKEAKADVALGLPNDTSNRLQTINLQILPLQTATIMGNVDIMGDTNLIGHSLVDDNWHLSNLTKITLSLVSQGIIVPPPSIPANTAPVPTPIPVNNPISLLLLSLLILLTSMFRTKTFQYPASDHES